MGFEYQVDHEQRRIMTQATGLISYPDIEAHMASEVRDRAHSYAELIDARQATADFTAAEVRQCVHFLNKLATQSVLGPIAVVVSHDLAYGIFRMFGMLVEETCAIRPFRTLAEAQQWLGWKT
jgi:hypothetical protein